MMVSEARGTSLVKDYTPDIPCWKFTELGLISSSANVPQEVALVIFVNGNELVRINCTPDKLNYLVLGFLYNEGIVSGLSDIAGIKSCNDEFEFDVTLSDTKFEIPETRTLTSGCTGGVAFAADVERVKSNTVVTFTNIAALMNQFLKQMELYPLCGGVHASALCTASKVVVIAEDIGRHNTVDKIQGECMMMGISTKDAILLSTGRVSSEMLLKAARMQVPVVVSRTSPTVRAITLAEEMNITLIGYARSKSLIVYSHPDRLHK